MKKKINPIILVFVSLFVLSAFYLFWASHKFSSPDNGEAWWAVYFENPKDASLDFWIENHSQDGNFRWEIWKNNKERIQEESVTVASGEEKEINFSGSFSPGDKVLVKVFSTDSEKDIYKNF